MDPIYESYLDEALAAKKLPVTLNDIIPPEKSIYNDTEGKWNASVGNTEVDIKKAIEKHFKKKVKSLGLFDHRGREIKSKPRTFSGSGTFIVSFK